MSERVTVLDEAIERCTKVMHKAKEYGQLQMAIGAMKCVEGLAEMKGKPGAVGDVNPKPEEALDPTEGELDTHLDAWATKEYGDAWRENAGLMVGIRIKKAFHAGYLAANKVLKR